MTEKTVKDEPPAAEEKATEKPETEWERLCRIFGLDVKTGCGCRTPKPGFYYHQRWWPG